MSPSLAKLASFAAGLPVGAAVGVTADGDDHFPTMAIALAVGWHVRTGLEDVVWVEPGTIQRHFAT